MKILKWLDENIESVLMAIFLSFIVMVMGLQIIMRYVFNSSLTWSEELTRYLFVWSTFLSLSYSIKNNSSIRIVQFINMVPKTVQKVIKIVTDLVILIFLVYLFKISLNVAVNTYQRDLTSPALGLPMYLIQISATMGFFLSSIRVIQSLFMTIKTENA